MCGAALTTASRKRQSVKQEVIKGQRTAGTHGSVDITVDTAWHHGIMGLCGLHGLTAHFIFHQDVITLPTLPSENRTVPQVTWNLNAAQ